jgi:hypothetical protein
MKTFVGVYLSIAAFLAGVGDHAFAASSTTCLCRTDDGAAFHEQTHRHHRWACDFKLGYARRADGDDAKPARPTTQTCNAEEVIQYKVWACMERGCTYQYSKRLEVKNPALEVVEPLEGKRKP